MKHKDYIYSYEVKAIGFSCSSIITLVRFTSAKEALKYIREAEADWKQIWLEKQYIYKRKPF